MLQRMSRLLLDRRGFLSAASCLATGLAAGATPGLAGIGEKEGRLKKETDPSSESRK